MFMCRTFFGGSSHVLEVISKKKYFLTWCGTFCDAVIEWKCQPLSGVVPGTLNNRLLVDVW